MTKSSQLVQAKEVCTTSRKSQENASVAQSDNKERLWHRRFGHLNEQSMKKLVKKDLVSQLDCDMSGGIGICKACIGGKQCKNSFKQSDTTTLMPLELVHSDVCGKMGHKSLGGAEYFLTLLDDKTHYIWVYPWVYPSRPKTRSSSASRNGRQKWKTSQAEK